MSAEEAAEMPGEEPRRRSVAVCLLTCNRNRQLTGALGGLSRLVWPDADVRVVVVDNAPDGGARAIVDEFARSQKHSKGCWPIDYVAEPERGIAHARNRAIGAAGDVDFVAFIDDDEVPDPKWLHSLFEVQTSSGADVVVGRVDASFASPPPKWVMEGKFFDRERFPTGQRMNWARTGNVLISRAVFNGRDAPFDERFNLSGGEDTHFFMRARDDGAVIVSADDAVVVEEVPPERATWRSIMQREYRRGNTLSLCLRDMYPSWLRRTRRFAQGGLRISQGVAMLALVPLNPRARFALACHRMSYGVGLLTGLAGVRYEAYRAA